jgi:hypothetical protein
LTGFVEHRDDDRQRHCRTPRRVAQSDFGATTTWVRRRRIIRRNSFIGLGANRKERSRSVPAAAVVGTYTTV